MSMMSGSRKKNNEWLTDEEIMKRYSINFHFLRERASRGVIRKKILQGKAYYFAPDMESLVRERDHIIHGFVDTDTEAEAE